MQRRRRIGAYGLCRDGARVLLTRASARSEFPGVWQLPGGGVEHGEHPAAAVVREFAEETGLVVAVTGLRTVLADVVRLPGPAAEHTDRVVYDVSLSGGTLRDEADGGSDLAAWVAAEELSGLPLMPFTAELLGRPVSALPEIAVPPEGAAPPGGGLLEGAVPPEGAGPPGDAPRPAGARAAGPVPPDRGQRFAAYGLVTDPAARVLLTLIADGYPGAGRWHLPGGGTDHGEQPAAALLRELVEESGQLGRVVELLDVSHLHLPAAYGPEGRPMDWHAVRAIYRLVVAAPTEPRVTEEAGGSTAGARWFTPAQAAALPLTDVARAALRRLPG